MTTIRIRAKVSEDRRISLILPPEVQPGEHDFEVTVRNGSAETPVEVILPADVRSKIAAQRVTHPALIAEQIAFENQLPELLRACGKINA